MLKKMGLVLAALVMVLAACGGDGGGLSAEAQAKADEIAAELTADTTPENPLADPEDAACFSEGLVRELGLDRINELDTGGGVEEGFTNMTAEEQGKVADVALACIDFPAMIREQLAGAGFTEDQANCVADGMNDDLVKALFLSTVSGQDVTSNTDLMGLVTTCLIG